ncbi:MAG TPA: FtsX-like permease family protein [Ilumatobacteraceae bacterium]|nr:FtsX-like permease family protein [Ilumatobacteraceae bacterium]
MPAMLLRVRVWMRRRARQLVVTAGLLGLAGGLVIGLAAGTRRTESAPDRYTARFGGDPDLVITQLHGKPLTAQVAAIPGVREAKSIAFVPSFVASPIDGTPVLEANPFAGDDQVVGARIVEGRFADPSQPDEFTINRTLAEMLAQRFGARVGDQFQVVSYDQQQVDTNTFEPGVPPAVPAFTATLVGITESPSDFDEASPQMIFSRSFLDAHPSVGVVQTIIAVKLAGGGDTGAVMDAVHRLTDGEDAYSVPTRIVSPQARRAVRFQVTALWLVTAIAVLSAAFVVAQIVRRQLSMDANERSSLLAVGWRPRDILIERGVEGAVVALMAMPGAGVVGHLLTAAFPLGVLRTFEPQRGPRMDWTITLCGVLALAVVVVASAAFAGRQRRWIDDREARGGGLGGLATVGGDSMPLATGAGMVAPTSRVGRRSLGSLLPAAVGLAGLVGAVIVGVSLANIVDAPGRWGVNYDQLFGNPFVSAEDDIVTPALNDPNVSAVTGATIGSLTINGRDTAALAVDARKGNLLPTTLRGRPPTGDDEIGLGAEVARRLGVDVDDEVEVVGATGETRRVRVVGIVVTPDNAGNGAAMTFDGYAALNPTATQNILFVNFRDGAPANAADHLSAAIYFSPPDALTKPTSVRALQRVTAAPFLLGIVLTVLLVVGCAYLLTMSVRARRRDLAVLRALGANHRQLRAVVHWQATLTTLFVVAVGVPIGVVAGRWVVRLLTDALGIVPGASVPMLLLLGIVAGALLLANLLAVGPARQATRASVAQLTRDV